MQAKFGGVEDDLHDDNDEDEEKEKQKAVWGGRKHLYYDADNRDYEVRICIVKVKCPLAICLTSLLIFLVYNH